MTRALVVMCCFVGAVLLKMSLGCDQVPSAKIAETVNGIVLPGAECLYAVHEARMTECAERATEVDARACADEAEAAFSKLEDAVKLYRCAVGGACQ